MSYRRHSAGQVVLNSTKIRADAGSESMLPERPYEARLEELQHILAEAKTTEAREAAEGDQGAVRLGQELKPEQMRHVWPAAEAAWRTENCRRF